MAPPLPSQGGFCYYQFWESFYDNDYHETDAFFRMLLGPMIDAGELPTPVHIVSVFGTMPFWGCAGETPGTVLSWSGEERYNTDTERYHASLVMRANDPARGLVCLPLFIIGSYAANLWPLYAVPRPLVAPKNHFCLFVVSNPNCEVRNRFFQRLSARYKPVHSCGPAFNNTGVLAPRARDDYFRFISQFRFMICFENTSAVPEYMTEKLHNAWAGGAIPIYWGASRAREWLNPRAFLYLEDESDAGMDRLIERVAALDRDEAAYRAMHAEPLLRDGGAIPEDLSLEGVRARLREALGAVRPDIKAAGVVKGNHSRE